MIDLIKTFHNVSIINPGGDTDAAAWAMLGVEPPAPDARIQFVDWPPFPSGPGEVTWVCYGLVD